MPIRLLRLARELFNPKPLPPENVISGRIESSGTAGSLIWNTPSLEMSSNLSTPKSPKI
jgi:hypothetical protein